MESNLTKQAIKVWDGIRLDGELAGVVLNVEKQKQLLDFFHIGKYYFYLFDVTKAQFTYISPGILDILGYDADTYDVEFHFSKMHPDDRLNVLDFENAAVKFFRELPNEKIIKYKFSYDFRILNAAGKYVRIHQQVATIEFNPAENRLITFGIHTDISELKNDERPKLSFIGFDGEPSYHDVDVQKTFSPAKLQFTRRQREILKLLLEGRQSHEIADILCISKHTVDTHRKQLLARTNCKSNMELAAKVVREGLI